MIKGLEVFTRGQIQDTLNMLKIMERNAITIDDLRAYLKTDLNVDLPPKKSRRGFMKRTTKADREAMKEQRGLMKQPCKSCDEKRRGKR